MNCELQKLQIFFFNRHQLETKPRKRIPDIFRINYEILLSYDVRQDSTISSPLNSSATDIPSTAEPCSPPASSLVAFPANLSPMPSGARLRLPPAVLLARTSPRYPTLPQSAPSLRRETAARSCSRSVALCPWPRYGSSHAASKSKPNRHPPHHRSSPARP